MKIVATNAAGILSITAGRGTIREYDLKWARGEVIETIALDKRSEKWFGLTGMYTGGQWFSDLQIVAQEGQLDVPNVSEALHWMVYCSGNDWVYNDTGLAIGFTLEPERWYIDVDVVQILINGKPPTHMPKSQNSKIVLMDI